MAPRTHCSARRALNSALLTCFATPRSISISRFTCFSKRRRVLISSLTKSFAFILLASLMVIFGLRESFIKASVGEMFEQRLHDDRGGCRGAGVGGGWGGWGRAWMGCKGALIFVSFWASPPLKRCQGSSVGLRWGSKGDE